MNAANTIHQLLADYVLVNQRRRILAAKEVGMDPEEFKQHIMPPDAPGEYLPTLDPNCEQQLTPMLRARFQFSGTWLGAHAGCDWLGLKDIRDLTYDARVTEVISLRTEFWNDSPIAQLPRWRISLFGLDLEQSEEIYLVWPESPGDEPEIHSFVSNFEEQYCHL